MSGIILPVIIKILGLLFGLIRGIGDWIATKTNIPFLYDVIILVIAFYIGFKISVWILKKISWLLVILLGILLAIAIAGVGAI
jgi:hypothetical protein